MFLLNTSAFFLLENQVFTGSVVPLAITQNFAQRRILREHFFSQQNSLVARATRQLALSAHNSS
jgi:hypothetical protein